MSRVVSPVPPTRRGQPRPAEVRATPALVRDVHELFELEARIGRARAAVDELEELRLDLRRRLSRRVAPGLWRIGEFILGRTRVEPEPTIDVKAAIAAGVVDAAVLEPFKRSTTSYERWTIKKRAKARRRVPDLATDLHQSIGRERKGR